MSTATTQSVLAVNSSTALPCPLCCQTNFPNVDSLRISLVSVSSRLLQCPICYDMLMGLDKLTIHLFSHTILNSSGSAHNNHHPVDLQPAHQQQHAVHNQHLVAQHQQIVTTPGDQNQQQAAASQTSNAQSAGRTCQAQCHTCGCTFRNHELHQMHMQLVHDITIADPSDEDCDQAVHMADASDPSGQRCRLPPAQQRQKAAANVSRFQCHLCQKNFKLKGSLRVHLRVVHQADGSSASANIVGAIPADVSGSSTTGGSGSVVCTIPIVYEHGENAAAAHSSHMMAKNIVVTMGTDADSPTMEAGYAATDRNGSTDTSKLWECDICTKWFTTKYFLKKHKRLHTGEMPYTCEHCNKTFTFQQSYHKHLLYHTDDKPHVCLTCGRAFKEMSTLHNHERIHSGEKPFKCETCDKCFRQRVSYLVHRRIHTGVMPYKCTACDKSFRYKVSQRTHKCLVQPPGEVVRQTGDLLQRLIQSTMLNDAPDSPAEMLQQNQLPLDGGEDGASDAIGDCRQPEADQRDAGMAADEAESPPNSQNHFATNQSLDAFVAEHCNMIGIVDDPQHNANSDTMHLESAPSPSSQFQNMCLYSPGSAQPPDQADCIAAVGQNAAAQPPVTLADVVQTYSSALDALDEVALSNFMNEIN